MSYVHYWLYSLREQKNGRKRVKENEKYESTTEKNALEKLKLKVFEFEDEALWWEEKTRRQPKERGKSSPNRWILEETGNLELDVLEEKGGGVGYILSSLFFFSFKKFALFCWRYSYESHWRKIYMTKDPKLDLILSKRKNLAVNSYCNNKPHTQIPKRNSSFCLSLHLHPKISHFSIWVLF